MLSEGCGVDVEALVFTASDTCSNSWESHLSNRQHVAIAIWVGSTIHVCP